MKSILTGKVLWSYDYEVSRRTLLDNLRAGFTGVLPFHAHEGDIILSDKSLLIFGDVAIEIPLLNFTQLYLGFDDTFPRILIKSLGLLWRPLRIKFTDGYATLVIYLIIDYNILGTKNQLWFDTLKEILSIEQ